MGAGSLTPLVFFGGTLGGFSGPSGGKDIVITHGVLRPRLKTCGQCLHARSKNGLVTPSKTPAAGARALTRAPWSASWIVKNGRKSPAIGI